MKNVTLPTPLSWLSVYECHRRMEAGNKIEVSSEVKN